MHGDEDITWTARRRFWHQLVLSAERCRAMGDRARALATFDAALDHAEVIGDQDWRPMARTLHGLGRCQEEDSDLESARVTFQRLVAHEERHMARTDPKRTPALVRLCWVRITTDERAATTELVRELREIVSSIRRTSPRRRADSSDLLEALSLRMVGEVFGALERFDEATDLLSEAIVRLKRCTPPGSGLVVETRARLEGVSALRQAHT